MKDPNEEETVIKLKDGNTKLVEENIVDHFLEAILNSYTTCHRYIQGNFYGDRS